MKFSTLFSIAAVIVAVTAAGANPVQEEAASISPFYNGIEPHFDSSSMDRRDDTFEALANSQLDKRAATCKKGTGLCSNDHKRCCPLGGRCCPKKGCCAAGKFCVGSGCCPNSMYGCDNKGCCPKNYNCCKGGSCCKKGTYCVKLKSGKIGCCPNGKLCYN
ncbi:hypothetical protein BGX21_002803 [Mortierella sp. AD011]|nr:hypothetical protein BGX20_002568 [Mortierella sp. AD010]KAF9378838.1 hypothetical protein BGX21_002803 [Mortierella sp. AD011]